MNETHIPGGFILLARKLLQSGIMERPPLHLKLWVWMLMQASFKDHGDLKRGQFFTSYQRMGAAMTYKVGFRTAKPTKRELEGVTKFLTKVRMVATTKVLHGMVITILNYNHYQAVSNYEGAGSGANDVLIPRRRVLKKEKPPEDFSALKARYSNPDLIEKAFQAIASTRKSNKVADNILRVQLQKWDRFPVGQVESGIRTYLEKNYASQGKREAYLLGIILNNQVPEEKPSTSGSTLLDSYYANAS